MNKLESFSRAIISLVENGTISNKDSLNRFKTKLAKEHGIDNIPSNPTILSFSKSRSRKILSILGLKPTRSLSGVAVVAVMTSPHDCPGNCIYCPGSLIEGKDLPKSYTGREPAAMRAVKANFDARKQVTSRMDQLYETGHSTDKIELVVMGGTFLSQPKDFQKKFMLSCINSITGGQAKTIASAKQYALSSKNRITGVTFETRPDFCGKNEIDSMLSFGGTRCELGVQTIYDKIYKKINRGHTVKDVVNATSLLKDSAFKVTHHLMPGLPGSNPKLDEKALREIFSNPDFKPDALKLYPCLVMPGTKLFEDWKKGRFTPMTEQEALDLVLKLKRFVPRWVRIMRIQRDIPSTLVSAGVKKTNLRQMALKEAEKIGLDCNCIRCREAGLYSRRSSDSINLENVKEFVETYESSKGVEKFISLESSDRKILFGFLRLRLPANPFRKEIDSKTALVRELRIFGRALPLGEHSQEETQHSGFGKRLLQRAEEIASQEFDAKKLLVISGLGTKEYYISNGFKVDGCFVSKGLN